MGSRGSGYDEGNEVRNLLSNIGKFEKKLAEEELIHEQNREKNGRGWYTSMIPAEDPTKVRITRGSKEKGTYEVKEVNPDEVEDYVPEIKPSKISEEKLLSAYKTVKEELSKDEYGPKAGYTDSLRLLGMAVNRYKGLDYVNLFSLSYGSSYGVSGDARKEIKKIEQTLGVKLL